MRLWTLSRAAGVGVAAGLVSMVLWPIYAAQPAALPLFVVALAMTAFCGLSVLAFTLFDLATRRRGIRLRPVRLFDLVLGLFLSVSSLLVLDALLDGGDLHL